MMTCCEDEELQPDIRSVHNSAMLGKKERGPDVEFEVGPEGGQTWRLTGYSDKLVNANPVMKALLIGPLAPKRGSIVPIRVVDVDPRAFECLLRYLEGKPPQLQSVQTALATIYAAHKYLCPGLEWECAAFLNDQILRQPDLVLDVLRDVSFYCQRNHWEPTAPPAEDIESDEEGSRLMRQYSTSSTIPIVTPPRRGSSSFGGSTVLSESRPLGEACRRLRHNCLQIIDKNADLVLTLEQIEDLDQETLIAVTSRDTLAVSNELLVFNAAERWAECECKRLKLQHDSRHLRDALGGYQVVCGGALARLLLLTPQQFAEGPARSALLTTDEQRALLVHLVGTNNVNNPTSPSHIAWTRLATARTPQPAQFIPIPSSLNGNKAAKNSEYSSEAGNRRRFWGLRWPRGKRKSSSAKNNNKKLSPARQQQVLVENKRPSSNNQQSCCSKTCEYFIAVLACLFD